MFFLAGGLWWYQIKENKAKDAGRDDHLLEGKNEAEITALGQSHPGFRYVVSLLSFSMHSLKYPVFPLQLRLLSVVFSSLLYPEYGDLLYL